MVISAKFLDRKALFNTQRMNKRAGRYSCDEQNFQESQHCSIINIDLCIKPLQALPQACSIHNEEILAYWRDLQTTRLLQADVCNAPRHSIFETPKYTGYTKVSGHNSQEKLKASETAASEAVDTGFTDS